MTHPGQEVEAIKEQRQEVFTRVQARYKAIPEDFRYHGDGIEPALEAFRLAVNEQVEQPTHVAAR